jgi:hypothetical protein
MTDCSSDCIITDLVDVDNSEIDSIKIQSKPSIKIQSKPSIKISNDLYIRPTITIGSFTKYATIDSCKCTVFLIDLTPFHKNHNIGLYDIDDETSNITDIRYCRQFLDTIYGSNNSKLSSLIKKIMQYISTNHNDIWKCAKRGDLIEDVSFAELAKSHDLNSNSNHAIFAIDQNISCAKHIDSKLMTEYILQNGLILKPLERTTVKNGITRLSLPVNMFTLTEFKIGYFDQRLVIVKYIKHLPFTESVIYWNTQNKCLVRIDSLSLNLSHLTINNILQTKSNKLNNLYIYAVVTSYKSKWIIATKCSSIKSEIKKNKALFLARLHNETVFESFDIDKSSDIIQVAMTNNIILDDLLFV